MVYRKLFQVGEVSYLKAVSFLNVGRANSLHTYRPPLSLSVQDGLNVMLETLPPVQNAEFETGKQSFQHPQALTVRPAKSKLRS